LRPPPTHVDVAPPGSAQVHRLLGQGGQGHVYEVRRPNGEPLALKWYKPRCATVDQFRQIQTMVDGGPPHIRFLWPLSIARIEHRDGFGYVMPLRDQRYIELSHLLAATDGDGAALNVTFASILNMCRQLCYSFLRLHSQGLCYRDISFGNVFFEPATGNILICDNDNVGVDDGTSKVLGTPFFMAPEVVRDETYASLPNSETDRHSLAVLLFYMLCLGHPLEGLRTQHGLRDGAWLRRTFGEDPLFCMHPTDESNRPAELVQQYWNHYPQRVRDLFVHAFVPGLSDPTERVTEGQWIKVIDEMRDGIMACPTCGATNFWHPSEPAPMCWTCRSRVSPTFVLEIGRRSVATSAMATVRSDHLASGLDDATVIGRVVAHPQERTRWGLRNESEKDWLAEGPDGSPEIVRPNGTIELRHPMQVRIDSTRIVVQRGDPS
jgi:DNA-binding helix-hairpin-helix protein with protein kinase domain